MEGDEGEEKRPPSSKFAHLTKEYYDEVFQRIWALIQSRSCSKNGEQSKALTSQTSSATVSQPSETTNQTSSTMSQTAETSRQTSDSVSQTFPTMSQTTKTSSQTSSDSMSQTFFPMSQTSSDSMSQTFFPMSQTSSDSMSQTFFPMSQTSSDSMSQTFFPMSQTSSAALSQTSEAMSQISETMSQASYVAMSQTSEAMNQASSAAVSQTSESVGQISSVTRKQDDLNLPGSCHDQNWVPTFRNLEDMNQMMLQALEASMIVLSTDGVIFFVTENITSLLGYLAHEVMGRKLLSFLPDEEKNEVYQKISVRSPLSELVGTHIDFCCHLKRGNVKHGDSPTYEYVKFILTIRDICSKSFVFFGGFIPNCLCVESTALKCPVEDRFFLVGSVCTINTSIVKELCTTKHSHEVLTKQESDEEDSLGVNRCVLGRTSGMSDAAAASSEDQAEPVKAEQHGQEIIQIDSGDSSSDTSISSSEVIPDSLTTTFHAFALASRRDARICQDPIDIEFPVDSDYLEEPQDSTKLEVPTMQEVLVEPRVQEDLPSSGMGTSRPAQVQPTASHHIINSDPRGMKETSRKQTLGKGKRSPSDDRESKRFCTASQLGQFIERPENSCSTSTQEQEVQMQNLQNLQKQVELQMQQKEKPKMHQVEKPKVHQVEKPKMYQVEKPKMQQEEELQMQQKEKPKMQLQKELQMQQREKPKVQQQEELQMQKEKPKMQQKEEAQMQLQMLQKQVLEGQQRQEQQLQQQQVQSSVSPPQMRGEQHSSSNQDKD